MFHSAAVRLTVWYLLIIMALSLATSFALYHVSSNHLEENASRQVSYFSGLLGPENAREFSNLRLKQLEEDRDKLKGNLIIFNTLILAGGGAASYGLARRTLRPIEEALEEQIRFSADASHELRTPLAAIQAENEVALRDPKLSRSGAIGLLESNLEEAAKLKELSEGLLSLAYTDSSEEVSDDVEANAIVAKAKERMVKSAELKQVGISLPTKGVDIKIKGNEQKLTDLLSILLDNAVKYSPRGSRVRVTIDKRGKNAEISVIDKGRGIKKSDLPHIFERFYRADHSRSKQKTAGYGLGLAIAKKIADQHGGLIEVRSAVGKGSVFTLRLPRA